MSSSPRTGADLGALAWEQWGSKSVPVFPCGEDKRPLCKWKTDATTDQADILRLFARAGERAVLVGAAMGEESGLFAIDLDLYKGGDKAAEFASILKQSGCLPDTRIHKTKSGGLHHIFFAPDGVAVPRNSVPYDEVEIRGEGGYILVPPSPGYEVVQEEVVEAPQALIDRLARARKSFNSLPIVKLKANIIEGKNLHDSATLIAAKLAGAGKSAEEIRTTISECLGGSIAADPNHHRHGRWESLVKGTDGELGRILSSAYAKYSPRKGDEAIQSTNDPRGKVSTGTLFGVQQGNEHGITGEADGAREAEQDAHSNSGGSGADANGSSSRAVDEFPFKRAYEATKVADEDNKNFIVFPLIMEGDVIVLSAEPKAGKTLTTMTLALHMGAGIPFGELTPIAPDGKVASIPVVYFALEGQGAIRKRVKAWLEFQKAAGVEIEEGDVQLFVVEQPINLTDDEAKQTLVDKLVLADAYFQRRGWGGVGMVVMDTLTKAMPGKDQNSVEDTSAVFNTVDMMRESGMNCAVMFIHHNNKQGKGPRGSSNILAEPDTILTVEKGKSIIVDNTQHDTYEMSVFMARAIDDTQTYKMKSNVVDIGVNSQGIMENAPVLDVIDDYSIAPTAEEDTMTKHRDNAKEAFYSLIYNKLSSVVGMRRMVLAMHRDIKHSDNALAKSYYAAYVNGSSKEQVTTAFKVLFSDEQVPNSLDGVTFNLEGDNITMVLNLEQASA